MATATAKRAATARRAKAKPAPAPEPEEIEDDDTEVDEEETEEVEELEDEEAPSVSKRKTSAQDRAKAAVTFGVQHLADYILAKTGNKVSTRELRQLIRKMARDGSGRVDREIVAGNRSRYDWPKGLKDPEVAKILKAYNAGELEADKQEKLAALKERKAEQVAAKKAAAEATPAPKSSKAKRAKAAPVEVDEDDEELDLDEE